MMSKPAHKQQPTLEETARHLLTTATTLLMLAGVGFLIHYFYSMTALLGIVLIITYLLLGPVNLMEKGINAFSALTSRVPVYGPVTRKSPEANPRILAVLIVYGVFFIGLTLGTIQVLPILRTQLGEMGQKIGIQLLETSDAAIGWADKNIGKGAIRDLFAQDIHQAERQGMIKQPASTGKPVTPEEKRIIQQTMIQNALNQLENTLASAVPNFISLVGGTVNGFIYFLTGLLLTFYFLIDGKRLKQETLCLFSQDNRDTADYLLGSFHQVMFAFVKGQVLLGILTGFYMFIIYSLFHVPFAFLLGCLFALAELLPVIGTWAGIGIGLIVILFTMDPIVAVWVWLCSYAYQTIKDNILAPKVVGDVMGLHPMVIILALLICAKVAGLLGVLLALPLASAINVILRLMIQKDRQEKEQQDRVNRQVLSEGESHA